MNTPIANILSGLLGGLVVLVVGAIMISTDVIETGDSQTVVRQSPITAPASDTGSAGGRTVGDIYDDEGRGVAFISATGVSSEESSPFGAPQEGTATGSGFVVDREGTILTNAHVVEGADSVSVNFEEGGEEIDAEVKGVDPSSDLAVLKVDPADVDHLNPIPLGDSSKVEVGDPVVAIGNPFGYSRTVTTGIVSGLQREIQAPNGFQIPNVIQTDASINPGNSGGPLLDSRGRVIGMNSQIATGGGQGSVGIGFAVPVNTAKQLLPQLKKGGEIKRAYLGIQMSDVTAEVAKELDLPVDAGALIAEVTDGGPADDAGLEGSDGTSDQGAPQGGDVLVEVDGDTINSSDDVAAAIADNSPGDEIEVVYYRDGDRETAKVELGERPDSLDSQQQPQQPEQDDDGGLFPLP
ncbi:MAG TPA: trypsin-like peptidase domain-containing protein [Thermoleophilaceae bacterium]|nr:trypsin-like peptidase domain-containing protein [Thermoleophilaceae bacterium]